MIQKGKARLHKILLKCGFFAIKTMSMPIAILHFFVFLRFFNISVFPYLIPNQTEWRHNCVFEYCVFLLKMFLSFIVSLLVTTTIIKYEMIFLVIIRFQSQVHGREREKVNVYKKVVFVIFKDGTLELMCFCEKYREIIEMSY